MKSNFESGEKKPSFKSYIITGTIIYTGLFALAQFVAKPFFPDNTSFDLWNFPRIYLQFLFVCILIVFSFIRNILCIKKDYSCREDYNQKAAGLMIAYTAVLLLIVLFVW